MDVLRAANLTPQQAMDAMGYTRRRASRGVAMLSRIAILLVLGWLALAAYANAAEDKKWLCTADASTGFSYKNGQWRQTNFIVKDRGYIVAKHKRSGIYQVTETGSKYGVTCESRKPSEQGWLVCKNISTFHINVEHLRYVHTYTSGYAHGCNKKECDTPYIEIGKCSLL